MNETFKHPERLPQNAEGPWYTNGECLACGLPESLAPDLLAELGPDNADTYFVRQPETEEEVERACRAAESCCVNALRYGGKDARIIRRLGPDCCDWDVDGGLKRPIPSDPPS